MARSNHTLAYIARKANVISCGIFARGFPATAPDRSKQQFFRSWSCFAAHRAIGLTIRPFFSYTTSYQPRYAGERLSGILFIRAGAV
jgi:hypothetical protein